MGEFGLIDRIRSRVFLVSLPGMTPQRERLLIQQLPPPGRECPGQRPFADDRVVPGEPARRTGEVPAAHRARGETFVAIMQRLHEELFQECRSVSR